MTWIRVDDAFADHPKIAALTDRAFRLHVGALCYCGRHTTNGVIIVGALRATPKIIRELVAAGVWHAPGHQCEHCPPVAKGTHLVHDYLIYNPTSDEHDDARAKRSERARRAALARWADASEHAPSNAPSMPGSIRNGCTSDATSPSPTGITSSSHSEPPHPQSVDDDEKSSETERPIDPVAITIRAVLDRCTDARMTTAQPRNRPAYRTAVYAEFQAREGDLRAVIASHPSAPVATLAGWMLGEPNSLHTYRESA